MKKKILWCTLILFILFVTGLVYAQTDGNQQVDPVDSFESKSIKCQYVDNKSERETVFDYNDGLFLNDATVFSPDIAKASAVLASVAYRSKMVTDVFSEDKLDFEMVGNGLYNYDRDGSINDMDFVAYSIGRKEIEYDGQKYALYCIPVRGTPGSIEWFSNFKLGGRQDGFHQGFYLAADEIISNVEKVTASDSVPRERRIIWITGHSRGAAVSNLVAGRLSTEQNSVATTEHIFCYTFACPAVGKNVDTSLDNIYNFNNPGDDIPTLPFEEWGYDRFGHTESLDLSQFDNFCQQYKAISGSDYAGITNTDGFKNVFGKIVKNEKDYYSVNNQMLFGLAAYFLGGKSDCTFSEMAEYTGYNISNKIFSDIKNCVDVSSMKDVVGRFYDEYEKERVFLENAITMIVSMSDEEFEAYLRENEKELNKIEQITGANIETKSDFSIAYSCLVTNNNDIRLFDDMLSSLIGWIFDAKGNVLGTFEDGHRQGVYITWINSMYYGYSGWMMNEKIKVVTNKVKLSSDSTKYAIRFIGNNCFYDCDNIEKAEFDENLKCVGEYAFSNCDKLESVTISNNIQHIWDSAFLGCSELISMNLKEGRTNHEFEIDRTIGEYAFKDCSSLQTVVIPDGIGAIEREAFSGCEKLEDVTMPADAVYCISSSFVTTDTFYKCTGVKKIHYTKGKTGVMKDYVYDEKSGTLGAYAGRSLESVVMDDGIVNVGAYTFYNNSYLLNVKFPDSILTLSDSAFMKGISTTFYGKKDSVVEEYANEKNISFIPLNYPMIFCDMSEMGMDSTRQFSAKVYIDVDQYTEEVIWSLAKNMSDETLISDSGLLYVSSNECATELDVICTFGDVKASVTIPIIKSKYIIIFDANGGITSTESLQTDENKKLIMLPEAQFANYKFEGWFTDSIDGEEITTDTIFSEDTTVYAHWSETVVDSLRFENVPVPVSGQLLDGIASIESDCIDQKSVTVNYMVNNQIVEGYAQCDTAYTMYISFVLKEGFTIDKKTEITINGKMADDVTQEDGSYIISSALQKTKHGELEVLNAKSESCEEEGYTGDSCCSICGAIVEKGKIIAPRGHKYATTWSYDENNHWHASICGHDEKIIDKAEHSFGEWITVTAATENRKGLRKRSCDCGYEETEEVDYIHTVHIKDEGSTVEPTCEKNGSITFKCIKCDKIIEVIELKATGHKWDAGKITKEATETENGEKTYVCITCGKNKIETIPKHEMILPQPLKKGELVLDDKLSAKVEVTDNKNKEVAYKELVGKKTKTVIIPATVQIGGTYYKVTQIANNAFRGNKNVTQIIVGSNVKTIGKNAFSGARNLRTVVIGKNVTDIEANAFNGCISLTSMRIPSKVVKIGSCAFYGCKKLMTVTIESSRLTSKTVASNAFIGISESTDFIVPKAKLHAYKKLFGNESFVFRADIEGQ